MNLALPPATSTWRPPPPFSGHNLSLTLACCKERQREGIRARNTPAEVQESPAGLWDVLVQPGQEVELGDGSRLVGLHVLQVEAPDQEVVAPDVFGHQVHLQGRKRGRWFVVRRLGPPGVPAELLLPRRCGTGWIPRRASSGSTASLRSPPEA